MTMSASAPAGTEEGYAPRISLARNVHSKFVANVGGVVFGMLAGIATARFLGPADKGLYSTFAFLASIVGTVGMVGLDDSLIVLVNRQRVALGNALGISIALVVCFGLVCGGALLALSALIFADRWSEGLSLFLLTAAATPLLLTSDLVVGALNARERVGATSWVYVVNGAVQASLLWLLLGLFDFGLLGGGLTMLGVALAGLGTGLVFVRRAGIRPSFAPNANYAKAALRYGAVLVVGTAVATLAVKIDLLLVYMLLDDSNAGYYSVAQSLAATAGLAAWALSYAAFPRFAAIADDEASDLLIQVCRLGIAATVASALMLAASSPLLIPILFGSAFSPAIEPLLLLLPGVVLVTLQTLVGRFRAARGEGRALAWSFCATFVALGGLTIVLVHFLGLTGAALAASLSPWAGLLVLFPVGRAREGSPALAALIRPRRSDFALLLTASRTMLRRP